MILFHRQRIPPLDRILFVESCGRGLSEPVLTQLYTHSRSIDLFTCYGGEPTTYRPSDGNVFRSQDYRDPASRRALYQEFKGQRYGAIGIVCSDEDILFKWKWMLAYQVPAKLFIVNENGDYFFVDYANAHHLWTLAASRIGLRGANTAATVARVFFFPITAAGLILYAGAVHARRRLRRALS